MRPYQRARSRRAISSLLPAFLTLAASSAALAQTALVTTTHTVVGDLDPPAVEHTCPTANGTALTAGSKYTVTLTDLGAQLPTPAPLSYVAMAVTQGSALAGSPTSVTAAGTPITLTAQAGASYTIHVVGLPGSVLGSGPIEEDVSDSGGNKVCSWIDTLATPSQQSNGVGILSDNFTVSSAGTYTVAMTDLQFPVALQTSADLLVVDTTAGAPVAMLSGFGSTQTTTALNTSDSYAIIAFAQEQSGAAGGMFSVAVTPASGSAAYTNLVPVGSVTLLQTSVSGSPESSFTLGTTPATLSLTDLSFPTVPLASVGAAVIDATTQTLAAQVTAGTGAQNFTPASASDSYQVYAYATPDSTANVGSYSTSIQQGTSFPFFQAEAVSATSTTQAFSFDTSVSTAGSYVFTLTDFKFPAALTSTALAAVQSGQLVKSLNAAGTFTATLAQGPVALLAFGQESSASSPGLMGVDLSPAGGGGAVFDATEGIGAGFSSTSFTAQSAEAVQANVADLVFPVGLANLDLAVTSGTSLVGSIASAGSSGSFPFQTTANTTYNINVLATPAAASGQQPEAAGTYAMSVDPAPVVTLSASSSSIASGGTVTLTWTAQNATACTASASPSNSAWSGSESASGGSATSAALTATTVFSLSCSGGGGTASASPVTVTVTAAKSGGSGGGGSLDLLTLAALATLVALRSWMSRAAPRR